APMPQPAVESSMPMPPSPAEPATSIPPTEAVITNPAPIAPAPWSNFAPQPAEQSAVPVGAFGATSPAAVAPPAWPSPPGILSSPTEMAMQPPSPISPVPSAVFPPQFNDPATNPNSISTRPGQSMSPN